LAGNVERLSKASSSAKAVDPRRHVSKNRTTSGRAEVKAEAAKKKAYARRRCRDRRLRRRAFHAGSGTVPYVVAGGGFLYFTIDLQAAAEKMAVAADDFNNVKANFQPVSAGVRRRSRPVKPASSAPAVDSRLSRA
jgi:hypothetical protein